MKRSLIVTVPEPSMQTSELELVLHRCSHVEGVAARIKDGIAAVPAVSHVCRKETAAVAFVARWGAFDHIDEPVATRIVRVVMVADAAVAIPLMLPVVVLLVGWALVSRLSVVVGLAWLVAARVDAGSAALFGREVAVSEEGWTAVGGTKGADVERERASVIKGWMQGALDASAMLAICRRVYFPAKQ
jgi:hypothetical protein